MASLSSKHQEFIVTRLARYDKPTDVQEALKEQYGVEATRDQIVYYNPETKNGRKGLAEKWKDLFYETRKQYSEDTSSIASAQKAHRIRMLEEAARQYQEDGAYVLMADMLEQIAKEVGGKYTNRKLLEHSGKDGGPIQTMNANLDLSEFEDTDDPVELMNLFTERFGRSD